MVRFFLRLPTGPYRLYVQSSSFSTSCEQDIATYLDDHLSDRTEYKVLKLVWLPFCLAVVEERPGCLKWKNQTGDASSRWLLVEPLQSQTIATETAPELGAREGGSSYLYVLSDFPFPFKIAQFSPKPFSSSPVTLDPGKDASSSIDERENRYHHPSPVVPSIHQTKNDRPQHQVRPVHLQRLLHLRRR